MKNIFILLSCVLITVGTSCKKEKPQPIKIEKKEPYYPKHQWIIK